MKTDHRQVVLFNGHDGHGYGLIINLWVAYLLLTVIFSIET